MTKNYDFFMELDVSPYWDEWVLICKERVVAHGKDLKELFEVAEREYSDEVPFVAKIPPVEGVMLF